MEKTKRNLSLEARQRLSLAHKKLYAEGRGRFFEKGHPIIAGVEKGWFKKGQSASPQTQFKKGQTTWNKNIQGEQSHCWQGGSSSWESRQARKVLEKHYGISWKNMCLPQKPIIHHIDHNRKNNIFNNLCVMVRSEHQSSHVRGVI